MQRAELEELRQREANLTALQAIGPRKKPRLDGPGGSGDSIPSGSNHGASGLVSHFSHFLYNSFVDNWKRRFLCYKNFTKRRSSNESLFWYFCIEIAATT